MTLEDQITALLAEAEPLRCLDPDGDEAKPLGAIVDRINALRAKQANEQRAAVAVMELDPDRPKPDPDALEPLPKRRRGRPEGT